MNPVRFNTIKLVWRPGAHQGRQVVGTLEKQPAGFSFRYDGPDLHTAQEKGFSGYPGMEDLSATYNGQAMGSFASRLLSRERPDFERILAGWGATPDMDNYTLLGLTFGRLPTDMYEFIPVIEPILGTSFFTDLAGLQHNPPSEAFRALPPGTQLALAPDPVNDHDRHAVEVMYGGERVAFVKKVHSEAICRALSAGLSVQCSLVRVRLNGVIQEVVVRITYV